MTNCRPNDGHTKNIEKSGSSLYAWQPHLASTYGSKNSLTPPTLLACFIIRASFETVKVLVTHGRTQKTHGENIITETLTAVPNTLTQQRRCYHATGHLQQTDKKYDVTDTRTKIWRHRHTWTSPQNMRTPLPYNTGSTTVTQPWYHDHLKWTTWNTYIQSVSKTSQQRTNIFHWENNHPVDCEMEMLISVEWISSSALNALSIALLSTPTLWYSHRTTH